MADNVPGAAKYGETNDDRMKLKGLEGEIKHLQNELNKIMDKHTGQDGTDQAKLYEW